MLSSGMLRHVALAVLVLTRAKQRNVLEDGILHGHRCENLKSCIEIITYRKLDLFSSSCNVKRTLTLQGSLERSNPSHRTFRRKMLIKFFNCCVF
jgi:hypothetical protein